MSKSDILTSLNVATMLPLDAKAYANTEAELLNLGTSSIKAHSLYKGAKITNRESNIDYYWLETVGIDTDIYEAKGSTYTYPSDTPDIEGIVYANKQYSFYIKKDIEVIPIPEGDKVVNKTGNEVTDSRALLDESTYSLYRLKGSSHISVVKSGNDIVIGYSEQPLKNWWDSIIIDPDIVVPVIRTHDPIFKDISIAKAWLQANSDRFQFIDENKVVLKVKGVSDLGTIPNWVSEVQGLNRSSDITLIVDEDRETPLSLINGNFEPTSLNTTFDLIIKDATLKEFAKITQHSTSDITMDNVEIVGENANIISGGKLTIFNSVIGGINYQEQPAIIVNEGSHLIIDNSTLNNPNLITIATDNNDVLLTNNNVRDTVIGEIIQTKPGFTNSKLTAINNITPQSNIADSSIPYIVSINNSTKEGTSYSLKTFQNIEHAESVLGPGKMFIEERESTRFVNITRSNG